MTAKAVIVSLGFAGTAAFALDWLLCEAGAGVSNEVVTEVVESGGDFLVIGLTLFRLVIAVDFGLLKHSERKLAALGELSGHVTGESARLQDDHEVFEHAASRVGNGFLRHMCPLGSFNF